LGETTVNKTRRKHSVAIRKINNLEDIHCVRDEELVVAPLSIAFFSSAGFVSGCLPNSFLFIVENRWLQSQLADGSSVCLLMEPIGQRFLCAGAARVFFTMSPRQVHAKLSIWLRKAVDAVCAAIPPEKNQTIKPSAITLSRE
jgi:hypothetical protein